MIVTIAARELKALFLSPMAWAILAVVQAIVAYFFLIYLDYFVSLQPQLAILPNAPGITTIVVTPLYATVAIVLLLVVPLLTMRVISEERRNRTLTLLMSAPVSVSEIVLGKFAGVVSFLLVMLLLLSLMPLSLMASGSLDMGLMLSGIVGTLLVICSFAAAGLYISALTSQPTVAAVGTFGLLLLLWIVDIAGDAGNERNVLSYLSMLNHNQALLRGIFSTADVIYYLLFITVFLVLSIRRLDAERLRH
ncbi:MAG: ABC transporter permease [Gammaproteobacteria bacterium]|nr:ABC transporter permease [Gammaproteobacteria bacterium]